jgi:cyclohexanone monooxygenase
MFTKDFPNCFIFAIQQAGFTPNVPHILDEQARHFAYVVSECYRRNLKTIEASEDAQAAWVQECLKVSDLRRDFLSLCTPSYYNDEGKLGDGSILTGRNGPYGGGPIKFIEMLEKWRAEGHMEGLVCTPA